MNETGFGNSTDFDQAKVQLSIPNTRGEVRQLLTPQRFAILTHDFPTLHWDLLLEDGRACKTWRLGQPPESGCLITAEVIADHRPFYLNYEGPVSGNRGNVTQWDAGTIEWIERREDLVEVKIHGRVLTGQIRLKRDTTGNWQCSFGLSK